MEQDEAKTNRPTPASFAACASRTVASRLIARVRSGESSPIGSFESAARWTIASYQPSSDASTSRTSFGIAACAGSSRPRSQPA